MSLSTELLESSVRKNNNCDRPLEKPLNNCDGALQLKTNVLPDKTLMVVRQS